MGFIWYIWKNLESIHPTKPLRWWWAVWSDSDNGCDQRRNLRNDHQIREWRTLSSSDSPKAFLRDIWKIVHVVLQGSLFQFNWQKITFNRQNSGLTTQNLHSQLNRTRFGPQYLASWLITSLWQSPCVHQAVGQGMHCSVARMELQGIKHSSTLEDKSGIGERTFAQANKRSALRGCLLSRSLLCLYCPLVNVYMTMENHHF